MFTLVANAVHTSSSHLRTACLVQDRAPQVLKLWLLTAVKNAQSRVGYRRTSCPVTAQECPRRISCPVTAERMPKVHSHSRSQLQYRVHNSVPQLVCSRTSPPANSSDIYSVLAIAQGRRPRLKRPRKAESKGLACPNGGMLYRSPFDPKHGRQPCDVSAEEAGRDDATMRPMICRRSRDRNNAGPGTTKPKASPEEARCISWPGHLTSWWRVAKEENAAA